MISLDNAILLYDKNNRPMVINLEDITYICNNTCHTNTSKYEIDIIHNIEKVQHIIDESSTLCKFLYLHKDTDTPMLVNLERVDHVIDGYIMFDNEEEIQVQESELNIYKKILEVKLNELKKLNNNTEYSNIPNNKVITDNKQKENTSINTKYPKVEKCLLEFSMLNRVLQNNIDEFAKFQLNIMK